MKQNTFMTRHHYARIILALVLLVGVSVVVGSVSATDPPNASFSCTPLSGLSPLSVTCTDASTNSPTGWAWFFGDETYTNGWIQLNSTATWSARNYFGAVTLPDGSIVVFGGSSGVTYFNDTYRSVDNGTTFSVLNRSSGWIKRGEFGYTITTGGNIIIAGGYNGAPLNDTWRSTDGGNTWQLMNGSSGWSKRELPSLVAMPDGSIILMGGFDGANKRDVWRSTDDGATWVQQTSSAGWSARYGQSSIVTPDGSIILMGGYSTTYLNDTWRSTNNGVSWTQMNGSSGWSKRAYETTNIMPDGSIVLMGGFSTAASNDVWRSVNNGSTWILINSSADWSARYKQASVTIPNGSIILMGGSTHNDVWQFSPQGSNAQNPAHTYTGAPQSFNVALQVSNAVGYNATIKNSYETIYGNVIVKFSSQSTVGTGRSFVALSNQSLNVTSWNYSVTNVTGNNTAIYLLTQNPNITVGLGNWSFSLNASNPASYNVSSSLQWVNVSAVTAAFSGTPLSGQTPLSVAFIDASIGSPSEFVWFFGDENYTQAWVNITGTPGWTARQSHRVVLLPNGHIILTGGGVVSYLNDTWRSTDGGITWTLMNASSGWSKRAFHSMVAMPDGNIILMGGEEQTPYVPRNDTWRSSDEGATWQLMNGTCPWPGRFAFGAVAMPDSSIVITGGAITSLEFYTNDTWRSTDEGATWSLVNASSEWESRGFQSTVSTSDGNIVLFGGADNTPVRRNDTWRSTDNGATWHLMSANAPWTIRDHIGSVVMPDGNIVLIAGNRDSGLKYTNDTWKTTDQGATWQLMNISNGWPLRYDFESVAMPDGSIVSIGGTSQTNLGGSNIFMNDTWRLSPQGSNLQSPTHQYTTPGNYSVSEMVTGSFGSNTLKKSNYIDAYSILPSFTASPTSGSNPLTVKFNDTSYSYWPVASRHWDFGDGTTSTIQNVSHTYTTDGFYSVNLTITDQYNNQNYTLKTNYINVNESFPAPILPVAIFEANITAGNPPLTVQFYDESINATSQNWSFGDGQYSISLNPLHTYSASGQYDVNLSVNNSYASAYLLKQKFINVVYNGTPHLYYWVRTS